MPRKISSRIQLEMDKCRIEELERLMIDTGIRTKGDLIENAIMLFELCIKERRKGNIIASYNECDRTVKQICVTSIERAAPR